MIAGIEFNSGEDSSRKGSFGVLNEAAKLLREYPELKVEIAGQTDDAGALDYNLKLSEQRASAVTSYLVSQGVSAERIPTRGAGPNEPLVSEKGANARQKNRRIELPHSATRGQAPRTRARDRSQ